jgi:hypothetical protein
MKSLSCYRPVSSCLVMLMLLGMTFINKTYGQDTGIVSREVTWQTEKSLELHSNQEGERPCKIVTRKDQSIDLICDNNTLTFSIQRVTGNWGDYTKDGSLSYDVTYQEFPGKVIVNRKDDQVVVLIDFTEREKQGMKRKFFITAVN